jgi:hypothetical protein
MKYTKQIEAIDNKFCKFGTRVLAIAEAKTLIKWLQWQIDNPKGQGFIANNEIEIKWLREHIFVLSMLPSGVSVSED